MHMVTRPIHRFANSTHKIKISLLTSIYFEVIRPSIRNVDVRMRICLLEFIGFDRIYT